MKNDNRSNSFHQELPVDIVRLITPTSFNSTRLVIENTSIVYLIRLIIFYHIEVRTKSTLKSKFPILIMTGSHNLSPRVGLNINFIKIHIVPLVMVFKLSLPHLQYTLKYISYYISAYYQSFNSFFLLNLMYQPSCMILSYLHFLLQPQIILQQQFQIVLLVSQINRQGVLFCQQFLKDFAALHSPHTLLFELPILLTQNSHIVP